MKKMNTQQHKTTYTTPRVEVLNVQLSQAVFTGSRADATLPGFNDGGDANFGERKW